jgi:hypothetical protein
MMNEFLGFIVDCDIEDKYIRAQLKSKQQALKSAQRQLYAMVLQYEMQKVQMKN